MTHVSGDEASLPVVGSFGTLDPLPTRFKGTEDPPDPSPRVVGEVEGDEVEVVGAVNLSSCVAVPLGPSPTVFVATTEIV
jgi:hypothetical protein